MNPNSLKEINISLVFNDIDQVYFKARMKYENGQRDSIVLITRI